MEGSGLIVPLRKETEDGRPYTRPAEIEAALEDLYALPIEEVARRAEIADVNDPEFVPSECVLHFVRQSKANDDSPAYQTLFTILRTRVQRQAPVQVTKLAGSKKKAESDWDSQVQEQVLGKFQELLCEDRKEYDERLDFYETRFNSAICALRTTAKRRLAKKNSRRKRIQYDGDSTALSADMEQALIRARGSNSPENDDFLFRLKFLQAINSLPPDQRRVIELILEEMPIDSNEPEVRTIAKTLACSEKTVRNRRDRAYAALKEALEEEDVA